MLDFISAAFIILGIFLIVGAICIHSERKDRENRAAFMDACIELGRLKEQFEQQRKDSA